VVAISLVGVVSMATVSLFQTGIVKHLPDVPVDEFDSSKVILSAESFSYPAPDGTIGLAAHAVNIILASMGGVDRPQR
jgi:hypothetical protein